MNSLGFPFPLMISQAFMQCFVDLLPTDTTLRVLDIAMLTIGTTHPSDMDAAAPACEALCSITITLLRGCKDALLVSRILM